jgi:hypothetical protein
MSTEQHPMQHFVDELDRQLDAAGARVERRTRRRSHAIRVGMATGVAALVAATVGIGAGGGDRRDHPAVLGSIGLGPAQAAAAERCRAPTAAPAGVRSCLTALGAVAADWEAPGSGDVAYEQHWSVGSTQLRRPDGSPTGSPGAAAFRVAYPVTTETWIAPDGAGQTTIHPQGAPLLPTAHDRRRWRAAGSPPLGSAPPAGSVGVSGEGITTERDGRIVERWPAGGAREHVLRVGDQGEEGGPALFEDGDPTTTLSGDPGELLEQLRRLAWRQRVVISGDPCADGLGRCPAATERNIRSNVGTLATGLLAYPATPRPLRAALLRMLADLPGAATLGPGRDPRGRAGTVVRLPQGVNDGLGLLLFDTASARLLAQGSPSRGADEPEWQTLYAVRAARVAEIGRAPSGR